MEKAKQRGIKIVFPVDYVIADKFDKDAKVGLSQYLLAQVMLNYLKSASATDEEGIPDGWLGLDVGPKSIELFRETVLESKTILWNG